MTTLSRITSAIAAIFVFLTIIAVYGGVSAVKCYVCDSNSPKCLEHFFVALGTDVQENCACCTKVVGDDLTERNCALLSCITPSSNHHACFSDLCNTASPSRQINAAVFAAAILLVAVIVRHIR